MQKDLTLKLLPSEAVNDDIIKNYIAQALSVKSTALSGFTILKKSIDARSKQPFYTLSLKVFINEPKPAAELMQFDFKNVRNSNKRVLIAGGGPAGLFASLFLIENGIKPIIIERGKDVRARRRDLAILNKAGAVNPESNYCFGEGGAGTYSDGKLYTRSSKRGDVARILNLFVHFGATENILYDAHPHIGTNKLPHIITAMRKKIIECGGEYHFEKKVTDFIIKDSILKGVKTQDGTSYEGDALILATGHSARDIFHCLYSKKIKIESKAFALGVRVEHPQSLIDSIQYHNAVRDADLPPASYSWVQQVNGKGVFSFCMCPGGIIAPAATDYGELVVNGWSPSKRNNPYANSGIVSEVQLENINMPSDFEEINGVSKSQMQTPLALMYFQQYVERKAYKAGGGKMVAPAQRLIDFTNDRLSSNLPACSYLPGIHSNSIKDVLPGFINTNLKLAFKEYGKRMKGYLTNEAVIVATESRTSSPVRIPRDPDTLQHPQIKNLFPCGEGAGYAGGIVSAAMDGERVAAQVLALAAVL
jgi:uncharacterized FAD-dependent dehydrogenase